MVTTLDNQKMKSYVRGASLVAALLAVIAIAGCGPKPTEAEKNAPPPPGPHGGVAQPTGANPKGSSPSPNK